MLFLNIFTFLLTISLTTLVIPSIVPKISFLVLLLLVFSIGMNVVIKYKLHHENNGWKHDVNYAQIAVPMLSVFILCIWVSIRFFNINNNVYADFILIASHLFFLVFIMNTKDYIFLYKKYYIMLVFFMALLGLIANCLVSFNMIDISNHYYNISEATRGAFTRDTGLDDSYAFPYSLGLILTGSGKLNLLGFEFFRISGWAHEPTSATLFIAPAIILLLHGEVIKGLWSRLGMFSTITTFWFFAMSVGSLLAFLILYSIVALLILYINYFPFKLSAFLSIGFFICILLGLLFTESLMESSIFTTKFDFESESLQKSFSMLTWYIPDDMKTVSYYFSHLMMWMIISLFTVVAIGKLTGCSGKLFPNPYALILLYIIIHSMKGSQETVFYLFFTFFWFYMAYFSNDNKFYDSKKTTK